MIQDAHVIVEQLGEDVAPEPTEPLAVGEHGGSTNRRLVNSLERTCLRVFPGSERETLDPLNYRVNSIRSADSPRPTNAMATIADGNSPWATTPGVEDRCTARAAGSSTGPW